MTKGISILICTHNGSQRIHETLSHLLQQKVRQEISWEIVLVDNASSDGTAETAKSLWKSEIPLRIIFEPKLGVAYARITGMNACRYSYIGFIDDDNWVMDNWVETAYDSINSHPDAGAVGGSSIAIFESSAPKWFAKYSKNYAVGEQYDKAGRIEGQYNLLWGAGLVIRKEIWNYLYDNGFKPLHESRKGKKLLSGEESEILLLFKLMGTTFYYEPQLKIKHYMTTNRLHWRYYLRLKKSLGASSVYMDIYKTVIDHILNGGKSNPYSWVKGLFISARQIIQEPLALLAGLLNVKEGNFRIVMVYFHLGRFFQKLKMGREYETLHKVLYNRYASLKDSWTSTIK